MCESYKIPYWLLFFGVGVLVGGEQCPVRTEFACERRNGEVKRGRKASNEGERVGIPGKPAKKAP